MTTDDSTTPSSMLTPASVEPPRPRRRLLAIAAVAAVALVVSAGTVYVVQGQSSSAFDAVKVAELVPDDTHLFVALNMDLASDPWLAVPRLLEAMDIEQEVRDDIREAVTGSGMDYDTDFASTIASVRRAGVAVHYASSEHIEAVVVIESDDRDGITDLFFLDTDPGLRSQVRDETLGLDFEVYEGDETVADAFAVTARDGVVYLGDTVESVTSFLQRADARPALSESVAFRAAVDDVKDDALLVGFGSGSILDHPDFQDFVDAMDDSAEVDPRDATFAFSVTASEAGWGGRMVLAIESGLGTFGENVDLAADIDGAAALTPDDALVFVASAGFGEGMRDAIEELRVSSPEILDSFVTPFEDMTGISLDRDIVPLLGSTVAFALGADDLDAEAFDDASPWVLVLMESSDPDALGGDLRTIIGAFEDDCLCDTGVEARAAGDYAAIEWGGQRSSAPLSESVSFETLRALLPASSSMLMFVNAAAIPDEIIEDAQREMSTDPESYDVDLSSFLGIGLAMEGSEEALTIAFVLPVGSE